MRATYPAHVLLLELIVLIVVEYGSRAYATEDSTRLHTLRRNTSEKTSKKCEE